MILKDLNLSYEKTSELAGFIYSFSTCLENRLRIEENLLKTKALSLTLHNPSKLLDPREDYLYQTVKNYLEVFKKLGLSDNSKSKETFAQFAIDLFSEEKAEFIGEENQVTFSLDAYVSPSDVVRTEKQQTKRSFLKRSNNDQENKNDTNNNLENRAKKEIARRIVPLFIMENYQNIDDPKKPIEYKGITIQKMLSVIGLNYAIEFVVKKFIDLNFVEVKKLLDPLLAVLVKKSNYIKLQRYIEENAEEETKIALAMEQRKAQPDILDKVQEDKGLNNGIVREFLSNRSFALTSEKQLKRLALDIYNTAITTEGAQVKTDFSDLEKINSKNPTKLGQIYNIAIDKGKNPKEKISEIKKIYLNQEEQALLLDTESAKLLSNMGDRDINQELSEVLGKLMECLKPTYLGDVPEFLKSELNELKETNKISVKYNESEESIVNKLLASKDQDCKKFGEKLYKFYLLDYIFNMFLGNKRPYYNNFFLSSQDIEMKDIYIKAVQLSQICSYLEYFGCLDLDPYLIIEYPRDTANALKLLEEIYLMHQSSRISKGKFNVLLLFLMEKKILSKVFDKYVKCYTNNKQKSLIEKLCDFWSDGQDENLQKIKLLLIADSSDNQGFIDIDKFSNLLHIDVVKTSYDAANNKTIFLSSLVRNLEYLNKLIFMGTEDNPDLSLFLRFADNEEALERLKSIKQENEIAYELLAKDKAQTVIPEDIKQWANDKLEKKVDAGPKLEFQKGNVSLALEKVAEGNDIDNAFVGSRIPENRFKIIKEKITNKKHDEVLGVMSDAAEYIQHAEFAVGVSGEMAISQRNELLQQFESIDRQQKTRRDQEEEKLNTYFKEATSIIDKIAILRELAYRKTGLFLNHAQIFAILLQRLDGNNVAIGLPTGAGKSLILAISAILQCDAGYTACIATTSDKLAHDAYEDFRALYLNLGIKTKLVREHTEVFTPDRHLLIGSLTNIAFLRQRMRLNGVRVNKSAILLDEFDQSIVDSNESFQQCKIDSFLNDVGNREIFFKLIKDNYQNIYNESTKEIDIDEIKKIINTSKLSAKDKKRVNDFSEINFQTLIASYIEAQALKKDKDYAIYNGKIVPIINHKLQHGSKFLYFTQQFLALTNNIDIPEVTKSGLSDTPSDVLNSFDNRILVSGTIAVEQEWNLIDWPTVKLPSIKASRRVDCKPNLITNDTEYYDEIVQTALGLRENHPVLIFAEDADHAEKIYKEFKDKQNICIDTPTTKKISDQLLNEGSDHDRSNQIIEATNKKGTITIATPAMSRGIDYKPDCDGGLAVIKTYVSSGRIEAQELGRSGRQGKPGITKRIYSCKAQEKEECENNGLGLYSVRNPDLKAKIALKAFTDMSARIKKRFEKKALEPLCYFELAKGNLEELIDSAKGSTQESYIKDLMQDLYDYQSRIEADIASHDLYLTGFFAEEKEEIVKKFSEEMIFENGTPNKNKFDLTVSNYEKALIRKLEGVKLLKDLTDDEILKLYKSDEKLLKKYVDNQLERSAFKDKVTFKERHKEQLLANLGFLGEADFETLKESLVLSESKNNLVIKCKELLTKDLTEVEFFDKLFEQYALDLLYSSNLTLGVESSQERKNDSINPIIKAVVLPTLLDDVQYSQVQLQSSQEDKSIKVKNKPLFKFMNLFRKKDKSNVKTSLPNIDSDPQQVSYSFEDIEQFFLSKMSPEAFRAHINAIYSEKTKEVKIETLENTESNKLNDQNYIPESFEVTGKEQIRKLALDIYNMLNPSSTVGSFDEIHRAEKHYGQYPDLSDILNAILEAESYDETLEKKIAGMFLAHSTAKDCRKGAFKNSKVLNTKAFREKAIFVLKEEINSYNEGDVSELALDIYNMLNPSSTVGSFIDIPVEEKYYEQYPDLSDILNAILEAESYDEKLKREIEEKLIAHFISKDSSEEMSSISKFVSGIASGRRIDLLEKSCSETELAMLPILVDVEPIELPKAPAEGYSTEEYKDDEVNEVSSNSKSKNRLVWTFVYIGLLTMAAAPLKFYFQFAGLQDPIYAHPAWYAMLSLTLVTFAFFYCAYRNSKGNRLNVPTTSGDSVSSQKLVSTPPQANIPNGVMADTRKDEKKPHV